VSLDPKEFPACWNIVPIDSVIFFQEGPGVRTHQYTTSGIKLLNGGNINNGILDLNTTDRYVSEEEAYGKYSHFLVEEGDLLIACSGVVVDKFDGKIAYCSGQVFSDTKIGCCAAISRS
jgi:type I restriction enzyme S subunit